MPDNKINFTFFLNWNLYVIFITALILVIVVGAQRHWRWKVWRWTAWVERKRRTITCAAASAPTWCRTYAGTSTACCSVPTRSMTRQLSVTVTRSSGTARTCRSCATCRCYKFRCATSKATGTRGTPCWGFGPASALRGLDSPWRIIYSTTTKTPCRSSRTFAAPLWWVRIPVPGF